MVPQVAALSSLQLIDGLSPSARKQLESQARSVPQSLVPFLSEATRPGKIIVVDHEDAAHWQAIERLRRHPAEEHARAARRAFLILAERHHPDQGGTHDGFLRLKAAYDRALAAWQRVAA